MAQEQFAGPEHYTDFDPEKFILSRGTLYLLATGAGAGASAALVAAFVEDLVEGAEAGAAHALELALAEGERARVVVAPA